MHVQCFASIEYVFSFTLPIKINYLLIKIDLEDFRYDTLNHPFPLNKRRRRFFLTIKNFPRAFKEFFENHVKLPPSPV